MKPSWFRIEATADPAVADVYLYDLIGADWFGDGTSAKAFVDELQALPDAAKTLRVHVNSPGGSVFDAIAMANALRTQHTEKGRTIDVRIEALAASAASIITSAGDVIRIADNAELMIHNPVALVLGQAKDMREMAAALDRTRDQIVTTYRWVSPLSSEAIQALMDATTWMDAEEAIQNGFATEIMAGGTVTAAFDPRSIAALGPIPERFRPRIAGLTARPNPAPAPLVVPMEAAAVLAACKAAGCLDVAETLLAAQATPDQVTARCARATQTRALVGMARGLRPDGRQRLLESYLTADVPIETVKAQLTIITAELDRIEIDTHLAPDDGGTTKTGRLNPTAIYAERNRRHEDQPS